MKLRQLLICFIFLCIAFGFRFQRTVNYSNEDIRGYWFQPHAAFINITFYSDGKFVFNDYNNKKDIEERLTGKYLVQNNRLILLYDDRPKQFFNIIKGQNGDKSYYIKKKGYYFVKK